MSRYSKIALHVLSDCMWQEFAAWLPYARYVGERAFTFYTIEFKYREGYHVMARKSRKASGNVTNGNGSGGTEFQWLNIVLEPEDIAAVVQLSESPGVIGDELAALFVGTGNFTCKFNHDRGNWSAFISSNDGERGSGGHGISASANSGIVATAAVLVKLRIYKSDPTRFTATGGGLGIR